MSEPFRRHFRGRRGGALALMVVALPALLAVCGLAIDLGHLFRVRTKLQGTADASALASASQLPNPTDTRTMAKQYAGLNYPNSGTIVDDEDVELGFWDAQSRTFTPQGSASYPQNTTPNAVRVVARRGGAHENPVRLYFGGFLGKRWADVSAMATAVIGGGGGTACIFQLHPTRPGLEISSGSKVIANCGVHVNSTHRCEALEVTSGSVLEAEFVNVAGTCAKLGGGTVSPAPAYSSTPVTDPLTSIDHPVIDSCNHSNRKVDKDGTTTISPGVYCNGLIVSGSKTRVVMEPGLYIMRGGGFNIESGATIVGDEVTIFNTCNHTNGCAGSTSGAKPVKITSGSTADLKAPSSGPLEGILFFQDRNMSSSLENEISSNTNTTLDGVLYFPTQHLMFHSGTSATSVLKVVIVSATLEVSSGTTFDFRELPSNVPRVMDSDIRIRLVQ